MHCRYNASKVTWPDNSFWSIVFLFLQGSLRDRWYWCLFLRSLLDAPQAWRIWHRLTNFWSDNKWNCWKVIIASYWWCAVCLQILEKLNKYCEVPWIVPPVGSAPPSPPKKLLTMVCLEIIIYSGTSCKWPPLMSGLGGRLWEVVAYRKFH